ncbi:MAG: hypothetical protein HY903_22895 [Deltaproteobacteria bacterium]|nr:hypothetical protein [Deltaproteobacteria bacterium]
MRSRGLLVLPIALLAACGDSDVELEDLPDAVAETLCKKAYECCTADEVVASQQTGYTSSSAECPAKMASGLQGTKTNIERGEKRDRLVYHGDRLRECLDAYATLSCDALKSAATSRLPVCDGYLEPKVTPGGACDYDDECIGGSCEGESGDAEGVCVAFVAAAAACGTAPCGDGLYCSGTDVCMQKKADGEACGANYECLTGGCNGNDPNQGVLGTCGRMGGEATACFLTKGCAAGGASLAPAACAVALLGLRRRRCRR